MKAEMSYLLTLKETFRVESIHILFILNNI